MGWEDEPVEFSAYKNYDCDIQVWAYRSALIAEVAMSLKYVCTCKTRNNASHYTMHTFELTAHIGKYEKWPTSNSHEILSPAALPRLTSVAHH